MLAPALTLGGLAAAAHAASLTPSHSALQRQVAAARGLDYAKTESDVRAMVEAGDLVRVPGNGDYELKAGNPWPYAAPALRRLIENLGHGYRRGCGESLVVTSLVRPRNRQPRNASPLSVHPTGTAVDLRVPWRRQCRSALESALNELEDAGVIEAARERWPPHYHVVVFPRPYLAYLGDEEAPFEPSAVLAAAGGSLPATVPVSSSTAETYRYVVQRGDTLWSLGERYGVDPGVILRFNGLSFSRLQVGQLLAIPVPGHAAPASAPSPATYRVRAGDNLWRIAQRHGTSTQNLQRANGLSSTRIHPGQVLRIPAGG